MWNFEYWITSKAEVYVESDAKDGSNKPFLSIYGIFPNYQSFSDLFDRLSTLVTHFSEQCLPLSLTYCSV